MQLPISDSVNRSNALLPMDCFLLATATSKIYPVTYDDPGFPDTSGVRLQIPIN